jgi:hypothetical protein
MKNKYSTKNITFDRSKKRPCTNIKKKETFKIFNITKTKTSSSKKIRVNSSQNILPAMSTPTKCKLIEAQTVKNMILIFESSPAADSA